MNIHNLHPVAKILIGTILCMMIGGGIGYIRYIIHDALDKREAQQKQEASETITAIPRKRIDIKL